MTMALRAFFMGLVLWLPMVALASSDAEALKEYVATNTEQLADKLDQLRGSFENDRDRFYREMEQELQPFVAFRRIAARVMGRYAHQASPEQRDEFVEKFKRSLFNTYAGALVDTENFEVKMGDARIMPNHPDRATVDMEIVSGSGKRYKVTYSMFRKGEDQWMMENVIVEGVNIGLAFRERFESSLEKHRGDIQAVIDDWTSKLDEFEKKPAQESADNAAQ
ncbi:ABC transporter substrate-binding protein [Marinobacteraceae bacterium S3BR75-40.1]